MESATPVTSVVDDTADAPDAAEAAHAAREAAVDRHFERVSSLMDAAETLASALLSSMTNRLLQGSAVYPGELIQLCRGLHVLAKCTLELRKQLRPTGKAAPAGISAAQIDQLEARLRPLFERQAA